MPIKYSDTFFKVRIAAMDGRKDTVASPWIRLYQRSRAVAEQLQLARTASMEAWLQTIRPKLQSALGGLKAACVDFVSSRPER